MRPNTILGRAKLEHFACGYEMNMLNINNLILYRVYPVQHEVRLDVIYINTVYFTPLHQSGDRMHTTLTYKQMGGRMRPIL